MMLLPFRTTVLMRDIGLSENLLTADNYDNLMLKAALSFALHGCVRFC